MAETCSICRFDLMRHGARQPKVLQCCSVVICRHCIPKLTKTCPYCTRKQDTPVDDLPTMDMKDAVLNELQKVKRDNYADWRKAVKDWIIKVQRDACSTEAGQPATEELKPTRDWILLLDTDWRNVVSLIIEVIGDKRKTNSESEQTARVTFTADSMFKVKVAMLEAARRLSFTQRVTIVTAALDVKRCIDELYKPMRSVLIRKLKRQSSTDYRMDLRLHHMLPNSDALLQLDGSACVIAFGCKAPMVREHTGNTLEITECQSKTETEEDDAVKLKDGDNTEKPEPIEK
ncbi:hypothetical protein BaRGS_00034580, partial [Batillaria attramentaria]